MDCIGLATWYMVNNLPCDQVIREPSEDGMRVAKPEMDAMAQWTAAMKKASDQAGDDEKAWIDEGLLTEKDGQLSLNMKLKNTDVFPILLVVCGSTWGYVQVRNGSVSSR